jgi:hypothetical protein
MLTDLYECAARLGGGLPRGFVRLVAPRLACPQTGCDPNRSTLCGEVLAPKRAGARGRDAVLAAGAGAG